MKYIHLPTLVMHTILLILAQLLLPHYSDRFLVLGLAGLLVHVIWSAVSKRNLLPSHLLGCAVQLLAFQLGLIEVSNGAFGLGGGGFAQLFYSVALVVSAVLEAMIAAVRYFLSRNET